jgi:NRPS condensation-like uncharacterized protein
LDLRPGTELTIPVMVDMRRYLAEGDEFTALTNLSSTVVTQLRREPEEAFPRTLARVKAEMDEKKGGDIGLVPSRFMLELTGASSGDMRLSDHAARSMI